MLRPMHKGEVLESLDRMIAALFPETPENLRGCQVEISIYGTVHEAGEYHDEEGCRADRCAVHNGFTLIIDSDLETALEDRGAERWCAEFPRLCRLELSGHATEADVEDVLRDRKKVMERPA